MVKTVLYCVMLSTVCEVNNIVGDQVCSNYEMHTFIFYIAKSDNGVRNKEYKYVEMMFR